MYLINSTNSTNSIAITFCALGVIIFVVLFLLIPLISKSFMYHPYKATEKEFNDLTRICKRKTELVNFESTDKIKLTGMLINYHKQAKWEDIIFLYSHGNGSWLGGLLNSHQIDMLSNFGSVFAYDYRQYGMNDGNITELGTYNDVMGAWNFLTKTKNISPKKIIVYGHSMGGAVSTKLLSMLIDNNEELPLALILDGTFSNVIDMGNHILPGFGWLSPYNYDNIKNLKNIEQHIIQTNKNLPIMVMHSEEDETVPFDQSLKIKENCKCHHVKVLGSHNVPIFNKHAINFLHTVVK